MIVQWVSNLETGVKIGLVMVKPSDRAGSKTNKISHNVTRAYSKSGRLSVAAAQY
jgi:hypothetical protein